MAHNIQEIDMQYGTEMAWYKKTIVKPTLERNDVPEFNKIPLEIAGQPYVTDGKEWFAVKCSDGVICGTPIRDSYRLFQPREAWDFAQHVLSGTQFEVVSYGTIDARKKWFLTVALKELENQTIVGREHRFNLSIVGAIDKSMSPEIYQSATRIVCQNTFNLTRAMKQDCLLRVRCSSGTFDEKLKQGAQLVEQAVGMTAVFKATMEAVENKTVTKDQAERVYAGVLASNGQDFAPVKTKKGLRPANAVKTVDGLMNLFEHGRGNAGKTRGDLWNGYTDLLTHGREKSSKDVMAQFQFSDFGIGMQRKAEFFDICANDARFDEMEEIGRKALELAN